jgi:hypothetical protein
LASPRTLSTLGVALLCVAGVTYLLGYRGSSVSPADTRVAAVPPPPGTRVASVPPSPAGFAFTSAAPARVASYSSAVAWTTSEASTGTVQWGPLGVEPVLWDSVSAPGTRHVVELSGLAASTTYQVTIVASSIQQETARTELSFTTASAPQQVQGTVRNGVLLVNGQPFLPLIAWQQCPEQWQASLDVGIDLFAAGSPCASPASTVDALKGRALVVGVDGELPVPGLLGWFYPDEADARGLTGDSLPALPPGVRFLTITAHFASAAAPLPAGRAMYPGLVAAADMVGFDLYPLQELCRRDLLPLDFDAQQQLEALAPGKATFQWIEARGMRCGNAPDISISPGTIRAESWLSLAAGAHGLAFFPPDWDNTFAPAVIHGIATRIHQIEPALLQPAQPVRVDAAPAVRASARLYHGAVYVIAVNAGVAATDIGFTVPGLGTRRLITLGRSGSLDARGDTFTDRIGPLGVRIYVAPPVG